VVMRIGGLAPLGDAARQAETETRRAEIHRVPSPGYPTHPGKCRRLSPETRHMRDGHLIGQATALPALLARPVKSILNAGILLSSASEREYPLPPSEAPKSRSVPVGRRF